MHYLGRRTPWSWETVESAIPPTNGGGSAIARGDLSRPAVRLLVSLKPAQRVPSLATAFPHVLNRLAEIWERPQATEVYFDELLLPSRNGRKGFDVHALQELLALREHHTRRLATAKPVGVAADEWRG
jgi:hypothetical protein